MDIDGHEYSLHYNKNNNTWYLSRFDYSNDTGNGYSGIFVHNHLNNYDILKKRCSIMECEFTLIFK